MKTYFDQGNFEPFVYKRLNEVIDEFKDDSNSYVVFDYDNTSIIMDIEDNLNVYLMEHLEYKLTPEVFYKTLTNTHYHEELSKVFDQKYEHATGFNLAEDISKEYEWLYDNYITHENRSEALLKEVKETDHYETFVTKLRMFHKFVNGNLLREPSYGWMTYLFAGHTVEEFRDICKRCINEMKDRPFEEITFTSAESIPGKSGVVSSTFKSGLTVPEELLNLYEVFKENNITLYIVSDSPREYVDIAKDLFGHAVESEYIVAMEFKTDAIKKHIMPKHGGKEPVAMFGDSIGDYDMMKTFKNTPLCVIFNRHSTDDFKELINLAIKQYDFSDARFVLQGRDENKGILLPSQQSIAFGETKAHL